MYLDWGLAHFLKIIFMTIETKYNRGDTVFGIVDGKIRALTVLYISIEIGSNQKQTNEYGFKKSGGEFIDRIKEEMLFPTKEALLQSL